MTDVSLKKLCVDGPKVHDRCKCLRCKKEGVVGPMPYSHWRFFLGYSQEDENNVVYCDNCTLQKILHPDEGICNYDVKLVSPAPRYDK